MDIQRPKAHQPLPENAKLVFKGEIFEIYQWEQEVFNGEKRTYEKAKRPDTVGVFPVLPDGKILLTREQQPGTPVYLSCAGGRVDPGEDPLTAAKRELLEETGYTAKDWILWHSVQPVHKVEWAIYSFIAKGLEKVAEIDLDEGEKIEVLPVTLDEFFEIGTRGDFTAEEAKLKLLEAKAYPDKMEELRKRFAPN